MSKFLDKIRTDILVADGAMGTLLYANGLDTCHEYYNVTHPRTIEGIHQAYIDAGADVIQTNTYGAQRYRLKSYGLEDQIEEINKSAVKIARKVAGDNCFVLGTVGGFRSHKQCELTLDEIVDETLEQVSYLLDGDLLDGLLFETYYDLEELLEVVKKVREITGIPIVTNITLQESGITQSGQSVVEALSQLVMLGVEVVGLNCHLGPYHMLQTFKQIPLFANTYLSVYPNASQLTIDGDSNHYSFSDNASYFGKTAEMFVAEGVRLIGGCCGTTPDHIRFVKQAVKQLKPIEKKVVSQLVAQEDYVKIISRQDTLVDKVKKETTVIVELDPPKHLDINRFKEAVGAIDEKRIAAITLADNSLSNTRICNLSLAATFKEQIKTPFLLHMACRDHNIIGLQSRLMGMDLLGFHDVLAITGDPSKMGDFPGATSVYDVNSYKLLNLIKQLNVGKSHSGASIKEPTSFVSGAALNPNLKNITLPRLLKVMTKKIDAGADYFMTQPIYNSHIIELLAETKSEIEQPIFIGIMPITSYNNAIFLHNEVPGITLSEKFLDKLEAIKDDEEACRNLALNESKKLIDVALRYFKGIYLITPFLRYDLICELIDYIKGQGHI